MFSLPSRPCCTAFFWYILQQYENSFYPQFSLLRVEQKERDFNILLLKTLIKRLQMLSAMSKEICCGEWMYIWNNVAQILKGQGCG